ncbi:MAG: hypothetical protein F7C35_07650, partial [Desulfurococcales archaeon]|nr:hypothetical protein [Desulfurococcales archaeon]
MGRKGKREKQLLAECYVNQAILNWSVHGSVPTHCEGVNYCLNKLEKQVKNNKFNKFVLLIDYESDAGQRKHVDKKINEYNCNNLC